MDKLFDYQGIGAEFLSGKQHALLADEMGLGKTVQAIRGLDRIDAKRALIVCPSVARINWLREFEMWSTVQRKYSVMQTLRDFPGSDETAICSFDFATENFRKLAAERWDALIVDEAHFLKSHEAKRAKAILGLNGVARSAKRIWLLSGTPAPNHPGELWIMLYTFGVTNLKYDAFINRYCIVRDTSYGRKVVSANSVHIPELRQLLQKIMLRRLKKDVMSQLPPITFGHVSVEPGPVDVEILPSFTQYFLPVDRRDELQADLRRQADLLKTVEANMKPDTTDKLQALAAISDSISTLRRYIGLQKCRDAIELIKRELESGAYEKIVIFAIHRDVIETMREGLRAFKPVTLYGGTDPDKRQRNIDRFQKDPKCRVFIGNIIAAGTAITLTAAHHVTFIEQDWVPGNNAQAVMRCHRIGQENPVSVRFIVLDKTLDQKIGFILKRKTEQLTQIFD
jgi:SWI/SNF-related matrix-associated actin-dependent regulator of chromatin subfamily A-like protein 1